MSRSLLLLTLIPFCLSADNPEVKEAIESVTYPIHSKIPGWIKHYADISIVKEKKPDSITYSQIIDGKGLKIFGCIPLCYDSDGSRVSYTKEQKTKEIILTLD